MSVSHRFPGLKAARIAANISAETAAQAVGMTVTSYYRYENGSRRIYADKLCVLADLLNCSLDSLRTDPELPQRGTTVMIASDSDAELAGWTV